MPHWIYSQKTGELLKNSDPSTPVHLGYAGKGEHKNRPESQCESNAGPIPRGWYSLGPIGDYGNLSSAIPLSPDATNEMCGRSNFLVHGESSSNIGAASEGCIVIGGADNRQAIRKWSDRLKVVSEVKSIKDFAAEIFTHVAEDEGRADLQGALKVSSASLPFYLGRGYSSYEGRIGQRVIRTSALTDHPVPKGSSSTFNFGLVSSEEDYQKLVSTDAEVGGSSGAFSVEAKASLRESFKRRLTSVNVGFAKRVILGTSRIDEYPLTETAESAAADPETFLKVFGDQIISGVSQGGTCVYIFTYNFQSFEEAREFSMSIGGRYKAVDAKFSTSSIETLKRSNAAVTIKGFTTGTATSPEFFKNLRVVGNGRLFDVEFAAGSLENLFSYIDAFDEVIEAARDTPGMLSQVAFELTDYARLFPIIDNQDRLVELGRQSQAIYQALMSQIDRSAFVLGQLENAASLKQFNLEDLLDAAAVRIPQCHKAMRAIRERSTQLTDEVDLTSNYDLRSQIPSVPRGLCTVYPEMRNRHIANLPHGWQEIEFPINKSDRGRTARLKGIGSIYHVGHRPGWGRGHLQIVKVNRSGELC